MHIVRKSSIEKVAVIHITDKCNLMCPYCLWVNIPRTQTEMSMTMYQSIIRILVDRGYTTLMLQSEGEVLMHSQYRNFLQYGLNCGLKINRLITNGILLHKYFDLIKILNIAISLDGHTQYHYVLNRGGTYSTFHKLVDNIKKIVMVHNRRKIIANHILTADNFIWLSDIIQFCEQLGVDHVRFYLYNPIIKGTEPRVLSITKTFMELLDKIINNVSFKILIDIILPEVCTKFFCIQLENNRVTIGLEGYLTPCCHIHSDKRYGTITSPSSELTNFQAQFNSAVLQSDLPSECQRCPRLATKRIGFSPTTKNWYTK